ncbi:MAG: orotidine-5'-phosphate decarboxylase [Desulfovibrionaceae bacterium]|nr:orotidine-5'-phosphate decarboxylase [Desulfovibrionaceae bacterium]
MSAGQAADHTPVLVVAVDYPSVAQAVALAETLSGLPVWLKVGLELFTAEGPALLKRLEAMGFALFLDLKFHDIPNTVYGAVRSASALGVRMLTVHTAGGEAMCRAAVDGRKAAASEGKGAPLLMGVTVLTSEGLRGETEMSLAMRVRERAIMARDCGLDGVVCSGLEVETVKRSCGRDFLCLCPGIRFAGTAGGDDQARVCTPAQAAAIGADYIVMGRPITRAASPAQVALAALEEMRESIR